MNIKGVLCREDQSQTDVLERQETEVNLCLAGAQLALLGRDFRRAEKLYLRAIKWGTQRWGKGNPNVGLILIELQEMYEMLGRTSEVEALDFQIHNVLKQHFYDALSKVTSIQTRAGVNKIDCCD